MGQTHLSRTAEKAPRLLPRPGPSHLPQPSRWAYGLTGHQHGCHSRPLPPPSLPGPLGAGGDPGHILYGSAVSFPARPSALGGGGHMQRGCPPLWPQGTGPQGHGDALPPAGAGIRAQPLMPLSLCSHLESRANTCPCCQVCRMGPRASGSEPQRHTHRPGLSPATRLAVSGRQGGSTGAHTPVLPARPVSPHPGFCSSTGWGDPGGRGPCP